MTYFGKARTHEQIDKFIRPLDSFTPPDELKKYAQANDMRASLKAGATLDDIAGMVDQGVPPVVLIDPDSSWNAGLHYVTVSGYERGTNGKVNSVVIADSAGARRYTLPAAEFQQRWSNLRLLGAPTGLHNVMFSAVPNDGRMIVGGDRVARPASKIQLPSSSWPSAILSTPARTVASGIGNTAKVIEKGGEASEGFMDKLRKRGEEFKSLFRPRWSTDPSSYGKRNDR